MEYSSNINPAYKDIAKNQFYRCSLKIDLSQTSINSFFNSYSDYRNPTQFIDKMPERCSRNSSIRSREPPKLGPVISFHNISYCTKIRIKNTFKTRTEKILSDVSGIFSSGMNAIMGPTGCGKTTLLDILANRKEKEATSGLVLVDGVKQNSNFNSMAGYVVQDDIIMGTLTVRENLMFAANMKLSPEISYEDKVQRVEKIIKQLGLTKCADTKIGTEFVRGVSGGERKRTCIGMELVVSPSILFLDEPTTGLDASTANAVMNLLYKLSREGLTVVFSIHQPRYSIFKFFDNLMLLAAGEVIYHGDSSLALSYFSSQNFQCEDHDNPPDFFLDVINGDIKTTYPSSNSSSYSNQSFYPDYDDDSKIAFAKEKSSSLDSGVFEGTNVQRTYMKRKQNKVEVKKFGKASADCRSYIGSIPEGFQNGMPTHNYDANSEESCVVDKKKLKAILAGNYKKSEIFFKINYELDEIMKEHRVSVKSASSTMLNTSKYANPFHIQLFHVSKRSLKNAIRDPVAFIVQFVMMLVFGLIVGGMFFDVTDEMPNAVSNRSGAFFFITLVQLFGNLSAIELFIKERKLFLHEAKNGLYRVSVYFLSKLFFDLIPLRILPTACFCIISYFLIGFVTAADKFFIYFFVLFVTTLTSAALVFMISALVDIVAIANIIVGIVYLLMALTCGLLLKVSDIPKWLSWLQYLSIVRYSLKALLINEIKNATYITKFNETIKIRDSDYSNAYLEDQEIEWTTSWHLWQNVLILSVAFLVLLVITYLRLLRLVLRR